MALPRLNDKPIYDITIPSLNKKVRFRPYLVREEKVLLLAAETKDPKAILSAIADTVMACLEESVDVRKLTSFDVEYMFLKIRSKSVGERAPLVINCSECKHPNEVTIDIDDIKIDTTRKSGEKIQLTDDISLKMTWPSYKSMIDDPEMFNTDSRTELAFNMIAKCIEAIQTEDEQWVVRDQPHDEVMAFLESLTDQQYKKIEQYVEAMPQMAYDLKFDCEACGHQNTVKLRGINDFF